jgi:carbamoyltransferase
VWDDAVAAPGGGFGTVEGEEAFFQSNLRARGLLCARAPRAGFHFLSHHRSHAASAYYVSPFRRAGVLVVDGIAEFSSTWAGIGDGRLERLFEVGYPNSLGFLWERVCEFLGFDRYDGPGKTMALGAASDSRDAATGVEYAHRFREFVRLQPQGQFTIDPAVLEYRSRRFDGLSLRLGEREEALGSPSRRSAIAAGLQTITEDVLIHLATELWRRANPAGGVPISELCLAGGVALNCVANRKLLDRTPWQRLWVQPATHDAGTALGAALLVSHELLGRRARTAMNDAYLGPEFGPAECERALLRAGLPYATAGDLAAEVADLLDRGKVVGWFQGRMEFGPRALGNPSVLADEADRWFDLGHANGASGPEEFMLSAAPAKAAGACVLPAVVHRNPRTEAATARVHVVRPGRNPLYESLLSSCRRTLGAAVALNTSFNAGEPIVCSPQDACGTFLRSGLDAMAIGPYLVIRT